MTVRPWLTFLTRRTDNYLFHDQTTRQALEKIFADYAESCRIPGQRRQEPYLSGAVA